MLSLIAFRPDSIKTSVFSLARHMQLISITFSTALWGRKLACKIRSTDLTFASLSINSHRIIKLTFSHTCIIEIKLIFFELFSHMIINQYYFSTILYFYLCIFWCHFLRFYQVSHRYYAWFDSSRNTMN